MKKEHLLNIPKHFKTICIHKYWVYKYCKLCGITWRGIKHDLSKFSPTEFFESIKYYTGTSSPIDGAKKAMGYSKAWFHHRGRNDHHYEMWVDNFDNGGIPLDMPFECVVEMLCDYLGAGKAYYKENFNYLKEFNWFKQKISNPVAMHIHTKAFIYIVLELLASIEYYGEHDPVIQVLGKDNLYKIYNETSREYTEESFAEHVKYMKSVWRERLCQEK